MAVKVAINGFGRIGRLAFRQMFSHEGTEIVAINDLTSPEMLAYLLKYDSTQGNYSRDHEVGFGEDHITVDGKKITIYKEPNAADLPWGELGVDVVLECTGFYTSKAKAQAHIDAGAKKVVISAPAGNDLPTIVYNVNHETLTADDNIISAASCTTNCLAPLAKGLNDFAPIVSGIMTTIHAFTGDQMTLDGPQRKGNKRRSRAASENIVPNSTGAAKAIGLVLPELNGKLIGAAQRVPTPTGSLTNLYAVVDKKVTVDEVNAAMKAYADTIPETFGYNVDDIVSRDIVGETHGSIFDATQTMVQDLGNGQSLVQVTSWYDNENSYTSQMVRAPPMSSASKEEAHMAFTKKTVRDADVDGKRVLVRVDFNVPLKDGVVTDDTRVRAAIPTITYLKEHNAKVILMSHLGRPDGTGYQEEFSLKSVAAKLAELTGYAVTFVPDTYGQVAADAVAAMQPGDVALLENVRFDKREKKNDPEIAKTLASYGDVFVLDAFGTAHRAQGSVVGPAQFLPAYAGFLLEKEVDTLTSIFADPARPFVAIVGGSKVSSKIGVLDHLIDSADTLIIGGGMAYTFFLARGCTVGTSLQEPDWIERAGEMLKKAEAKGCKVLLPVDNVVADHFGEDATGEAVDSDTIPDDRMGMDVGPKTVANYAEAIRGAKTVFWNGPMGVFEFDQFAKGTEAVARAVAEVKAAGGTSIIGGGDSVAAINKFGLADKMSWISTGGGASMELVEGKALPGVEALLDA